MCVCMYMTKTISLSDEAYNELKKLKNGYSFSEVILEITKEKKKENIMKYAGTWDNKEALKIKKQLMEERKKAKSRRLE